MLATLSTPWYQYEWMLPSLDRRALLARNEGPPLSHWLPVKHPDMHPMDRRNSDAGLCLDGHLLAGPQLKPEPVKQAHQGQASLLEGKPGPRAGPGGRTRNSSVSYQRKGWTFREAWTSVTHRHPPLRPEVQSSCSQHTKAVSYAQVGGLTEHRGQRGCTHWQWRAAGPHALECAFQAGTPQHVATCPHHGAGSRWGGTRMTPWESCQGAIHMLSCCQQA
jgi:hypothetical protein